MHAASVKIWTRVTDSTTKGDTCYDTSAFY